MFRVPLKSPLLLLDTLCLRIRLSGYRNIGDCLECAQNLLMVAINLLVWVGLIAISNKTRKVK